MNAQASATGLDVAFAFRDLPALAMGEQLRRLG